MDKILSLLSLSKRQQFVLSVFALSVGIFASQFTSGILLYAISFVLSLTSSILFFAATRSDLSVKVSYPIFILPFFYTLSFALFYPLIPARFLTHIITTSIYAFGLYSLLLTQNIFAVSTIRTINLLRSARIVSFVLTIIVLFLISNVIFSQRMPIYVASPLIFIVSFLLIFQSMWTYVLKRDFASDILALSLLIGFATSQLSLILSIWPINPAIYSIFITGMFYAYSGLCHAWVEKRLFRNVLWEYVWVGLLAILILILFSRWGS
ncbi:MAG TPA: hypothetical protein VG965_02975 [Patescibacteria group bacterium]|nr:hypothetical protein [Patescibacteria group bacterium]